MFPHTLMVSLSNHELCRRATSSGRAVFMSVALALIGGLGTAGQQPPREQRLLYVAMPDSDADADRSIRILVFDIANGHRFVRRIPLWPADGGDDPETVRGTAAHAESARLYISTTR